MKSNKNKKAASWGEYDPGKIEKSLQRQWAKKGIYRSKESKREKYYVLDMFPYPSGEGLHVGHPKGYIATDVVSRYQRMQGKSVLHPMGFDAFGLPAENYALKTKTNPADAVKKNVARYKEQLELLGFDYDWSREVNTTDPKYYKWTQWIFVELWKKGLAYESYEPINWCPSCKTGLANEDIEDGRCERCGTPVEKKPLRQWVLKITDYADRLLSELDARVLQRRNVATREELSRHHVEGGYDMNELAHVIDKKNPPVQGKQTAAPRRTIHALVRDPKTGKFLGLKWLEHPWITFIVGGVEPGEDIIEAAKREVAEETGYTDIKFVRFLGDPVKAEYFAAHKDVNRVAITSGILFEFVSPKKRKVDAKEKKAHVPIWLDPSEITEENMTCAELPFWLANLPSASTEIKDNIPCFTQIIEPGTVRKAMPFVERNAVAVIVKHWAEDKYIGLKWKKVAWQTIITGGIEKGQDAVAAALAEIEEETGYKSARFVRHLGKVESRFFHVPKNENRYAHFDVFYFELANGERHDLTAEENANHEVVWVEKDKMQSFISPMAQKFMWQSVFLGEQFDLHDGTALAYKPLLDWPEAIKEAQRNWIGRSEGAEIDFRLSFATEKIKFALIHGFRGGIDQVWFPWLKSELEKRGHSVQALNLPNTEDPKESEQVDFVLKNYNFDENTVVIGHSLGAIVALKALMKLKKKISGLLIVAAATDPKFTEGKLPKKHYAKNFNWDIDYELIQELTSGRIAVLADKQEYHVNNRNEYLRNLAKNLGALHQEVVAEKEHFCGEKEPAILKGVTPSVKVFTTRPDTIFGVTYLVLAPEHPWVGEVLRFVENKKEVEAYINRAKNETEIARTDAKKTKTGVPLKGVVAINPANNEPVPVWIADYVLPDYGTGAVMAVPAHDDRDFSFARKFDLTIRQVIAPFFTETTPPDVPRSDKKTVKRRNILGIVKHWSEDKYIVLDWKQTGWRSFIVGGIEEREKMEESAAREIVEETGYKNLKFIRKIGPEHHGHHYVPHKDENRYGIFQALYFELENGDKNEMSEEEKRKHEVMWVSKNEVTTTLNLRNNLFVWDYFLNGERSYNDSGKVINSGKFDLRDSDSVKREMTDYCGGKWVTKFKLRDWVFSRQRYWGEPIPVIHCDKCGVVPVSEKDLPVTLPRVKYYEPTGTGESPLAAIHSWVNVKCPKCKGKGKRETNTMPQWAGSSWYYLRYEDPKNTKKLVDRKKEKYWSPVDLYVGGAEHATRHLIYARFWHKFLYDLGVVSTIEPFTKLQNVGLIMGEDGRKMSKRFGNVVNPDEIVKTYGADTLRVYEMFMGPFDQQIAWSTQSMIGSRRFLERVWVMAKKVRVAQSSDSDPAYVRVLHKTMKKVGEDITNLRFNTAISSLMIAMNEMEKANGVSKDDFVAYLQLLAPFAPHMSDFLWQKMGQKSSVHISSWPKYRIELIRDAETKIIVQINSKTRATITLQADASDDAVKAAALNIPAVKKWIEGKQIERTIHVKGRLVNFVVK